MYVGPAGREPGPVFRKDVQSVAGPEEFVGAHVDDTVDQAGKGAFEVGDEGLWVQFIQPE